jgi:FKBP-type peptidyl-prolyl cis-trans isomerase FklB
MEYTDEGIKTLLYLSDNDIRQSINNLECIYYSGYLLNGNKFDSSVDRGQPATFGLNQVIPGWTEGLQLMPTGSKFRFFIHPSMAYGERQVSAVIGPNCTLIFDVELISFN